MALKKWTNIESCPHGSNFLAILKKGWRRKVVSVYVHVDNNFLMWRDLRKVKTKISMPGWDCTHYFD